MELVQTHDARGENYAFLRTYMYLPEYRIWWGPVAFGKIITHLAEQYPVLLSVLITCKLNWMNFKWGGGGGGGGLK